jgi:hypothetical protein
MKIEPLYSMDEELPVLEKIDIRVGSNIIEGEVCISTFTTQIVAHISPTCYYSLFVKWVQLPYPMLDKYAVYEEFTFNNWVENFVEREMHIARERVKPADVKKWLEAWLSIFSDERINLVSDEPKTPKMGNSIGYVEINLKKQGGNMARARQDFQDFIEQSGSMMQRWGAQIEGMDENMVLWTAPVSVEDKPKKTKRYKKGKRNK